MTEQDMKSLCIRYKHRTVKTPESIDIHHTGTLMALADEDLKILAINNDAVKDFPGVKCNRGGLGLVKFLSEKNRVVHTSFKNDKYRDLIKFLDFEKMTYLWYYEHQDLITGLHWSLNQPKVLISTSQDKTCKFWSVNGEDPSKKYFHKIRFDSAVIASLHPCGKMLTTLEQSSNILKFYDLRHLKANNRNSIEAVVEAELDFDAKRFQCTSIKHSPDGRKLLLTTNTNCVIIANNLTTNSNKNFNQKNLYDYSNKFNRHIGASFDPFNNFVFSGSSDGFMHVWNINAGKKLCQYKQNNHGVLDVHVSPKYFMFFTTSLNGVTFWNSDYDKDKRAQ